MKDKLDETIKDLSKTKKKEVISTKTNEVEQPKENVLPNVYYNPVEIIQIPVKDSYLPYALVRLNLFPSNAEARKFIRTEGVVLNSKLTHDCDATNRSENFEIEIFGKRYQVFKVD